MASVSCSSPSPLGVTIRTVIAGKCLRWSVLTLLAMGAGGRAFAAASTSTTLAVTSAGSTVTTVPSGSVVTLTATVKAGSTAVTPGQVNFCDATAPHCTDIHLLGTAQLTSAGTAAMKFRPGFGSHNYKAVFLGTTSDASSSSSPAALAVTGKYSTTTTIAESGSIGNYTLAATVVGSAELASPTGTVSFLDTSNANSVLGTMELGASETALGFINSFAAVGGFASGVVVADFNGDGMLDMVVANADNFPSPPLTVLLGAGDGTFRTASTPGDGNLFGGAQTSVAVGDFNGDGIPDLAFVTSGLLTVGGLQLGVELGNGDGTFTDAASRATGNTPVAIAVGDFNGDGKDDLVVLNQADKTVMVLLGNGDGTFTDVANTPATGNTPVAIAVGDFNGDGKADLAVLNQADNTITVLLGKGDGTFTAANAPATGNSPSSITVGDFNADGKADVAVANQSDNTVTVLLGNGDGTFTATAESPATGKLPVSIAVGDFNGDGKADLTVVNQSDNNAAVLLGNGNGTFTATATSPAAGPYPLAIAVGDFNGDGVPDLAAGDYQFPASVDTYIVTIMLTQWTQKATATASDISLPPNTGTHQVEVSYPGDSNYNSSVSTTIGLKTTQLLVSATNLSFGSEPVGDSTVSQIVTLTNADALTLAITSIKLTGTNPTWFSSSNNCGTSLASGATCTIGVRFVPKAASAVTATITVTDSATSSPQSIALSGTGIAAPAASLSLSATSLSFGSEAKGESTAAQNVTVTNTSSVVLYFGSITLGGANASSFVTSNTCGANLAAGAACKIGVRFVPTNTGPRLAAITVTDNTTGSPQTIMLSGTGIAAPAASLTLSASSLSFGSEAVGGSTAARTVNVTNSSKVLLYFGSITLNGANASSFVTSNTCGASLAAGATCIVGVRFVPATTGSLSAAITVTDNTPSSPQTIMLGGTGIAAPAASLSLSATSLSFGSESVGISTPTQTVTVTDTASTTLYFGRITLAGANTSSFVTSNTCGASLAAGATCEIGVRFVPTAVGPLSAAITLTDNTTSSPQTITLTGTGHAP